jgi:protein TonB
MRSERIAMHASTVVTRTPAGNAELANPAHGLSLAQRRFLTLLDTSCSVEELAARQRGDPSKVERDLARLASLGLVACATPAANDDEAPVLANDPGIAAANDEHASNDVPATQAAVRLGPRAAPARLVYVVAALGVAAAAFVARQYLDASASPPPAPDPAPRHALPSAGPFARATPEPIATRVLVGDTPGVKMRETPKEPPKARPTSEPAIGNGAPGAAPASALSPAAPISLQPLRPIESRLTSAQPFVAVPLALPVERRSPPAAAAPPAPPASSPSDAHDASVPVHVASAAPSAATIAPARRLVPITQEAPAFPREALAAGLANGNVKARVVVDAKGAVSSVEIVDSSHRAFDRTVREALSHWRFEPGTASRTTTVDVAFKRDQD